MSSVRFRSLSQIFTLAVVLISVPLVAGTVLAFFYIERLSSDSRELVVRSLEIGRESEKLIAHIEELSRTARQYLVVRDQEVYNLYSQKHVRLIDTVEWLELLMDNQEAKQVLADIREASWTALERMQQASDSPEAEIDTEIFDRLIGLSEDLSFFSNDAIRGRLDETTRRVETARGGLYWVWGVSAVLIVAFIMVFAWFIARPLRRMDTQIRRLGRGYFDDPIKIEGSSDIAELGSRLDWLRERLLEVDRIKEHFFRETSHQLKTPLASIREGVDLLLEQAQDSDPEHRRQVLELVHGNSTELQRMLDNMLKFSAWRADPGHLHKERFEMKPVVEGVVRRFSTQVMTHELEVRVDCPEDFEVNMDREKCRVILDNLVSNAVKFSPQKGVIFVRVSRERSGLRIAVSDQGPGIRPDLRDRIFELFYLREGSDSNGTQGSGIGLALVKAYAQAHGGEVRVESSEYNGARLVVEIPQ